MCVVAFFASHRLGRNMLEPVIFQSVLASAPLFVPSAAADFGYFEVCIHEAHSSWFVVDN